MFCFGAFILAENSLPIECPHFSCILLSPEQTQALLNLVFFSRPYILSKGPTFISFWNFFKPYKRYFQVCKFCQSDFEKNVDPPETIKVGKSCVFYSFEQKSVLTLHLRQKIYALFYSIKFWDHSFFFSQIFHALHLFI